MSKADVYNKAEDVHDQISRLRSQVESLMHDQVAPALSQVADRAQHAARAAAGGAKEQAEAISGRVRDQPLVAMLVAVGLGFLLGRVFR